MDAAADVAPSDLPRPTLGDALAEYPGTLLWGELRQRLSLDAAAQAYEWAADVVRVARE
jgi:hypothetical protein